AVVVVGAVSLHGDDRLLAVVSEDVDGQARGVGDEGQRLDRGDQPERDEQRHGHEGGKGALRHAGSLTPRGNPTEIPRRYRTESQEARRAVPGRLDGRTATPVLRSRTWAGRRSTPDRRRDGVVIAAPSRRAATSGSTSPRPS